MADTLKAHVGALPRGLSGLTAWIRYSALGMHRAALGSPASRPNLIHACEDTLFSRPNAKGFGGQLPEEEQFKSPPASSSCPGVIAWLLRPVGGGGGDREQEGSHHPSGVWGRAGRWNTDPALLTHSFRHSNAGELV